MRSLDAPDRVGDDRCVKDKAAQQVQAKPGITRRDVIARLRPEHAGALHSPVGFERGPRSLNIRCTCGKLMVLGLAEVLGTGFDFEHVADMFQRRTSGGIETAGIA